MATFNHKIQVANGNDTDVFHPETNTSQIYDFTNEKWLNSLIGTLSSLTTTQKSSLVVSINEIAGTKANTTTLTAHTLAKATTTQLGHVMPDGTTIKIDANGVISSIGGGGGDAHLSDYMPHDSGLSQYSSSVDANGFYRVVEYKRADNTLHLKSTASNPNAAGHYQTITWQFYAANGTTLALTKTWIITYDINGVIVSKVLS